VRAWPQVHPLALTRLGLVLQEADASNAVMRSDWVYRPIVCVGAPDGTGTCLALALAGLKRRQKHPVTREVLHSSHNGLTNVYGGARGLLHCAAVSCQVHSARLDFHDSVVLTLHHYDVDVFLDQLTDEYAERDQLVWSKEGCQALLLA
jgi:hypothetical protein